MKARLSLLSLVLALWPATRRPSRSEPPAEVVFFNAKFVTLDAQDSIAEAAAVREGRFVAVGSRETVLAMAGPQTRRVDLRGKTVIPGLADNHFHSTGSGPGVDLSRVRSLDELLEAIAERARGSEPGDVIVTNSNWHEGQLREQRLPYRQDLDRAVPDRPVVIVRGGHELILNSAALRRWGIDESTPDPPGGRLGRDAHGRLNGELVDQAKDLVKLPPPPRRGLEDTIQWLVEEHRKLAAAGVTSIRYAGVSRELYRALEEMERRGLLKVRVVVLIRLGDSISAKPDDLDAALAGWDREPADPAKASPWLKVGGVKLGVDGGFEGGWMREPYAEPWGKKGTFRGLQTFASKDYIALVRELNRRGWRIATHAVGDAAIDLVLDAYEAAHRDRSIAGRRWSIEHGFIPQPDQLPRMKKLGVLVTAQNHLYVAAPSLVSYWGPERAAWVTPLKAYLDAGIPVSLGTDSPVVAYFPLWCIYHFVTRDTITAGVMGSGQRVSREQALRLNTLGNAYLTFEEKRRGSIEPGKLADMVVLSDDIMTCPEKDIESLSVLMTVVDGKVTFKDRDFLRGVDLS